MTRNNESFTVTVSGHDSAPPAYPDLPVTVPTEPGVTGGVDSCVTTLPYVRSRADTSDQQSRLQSTLHLVEIDRRPLVVIDEREKYVDVTFTVGATTHQFTQRCIDDLIDISFEHALQARCDPDLHESEDVTITVSEDEFYPESPTPYQQLTVGSLLPEYADTLADDLMYYARTSLSLTRYFEPGTDHGFQVPRPGAEPPQRTDAEYLEITPPVHDKQLNGSTVLTPTLERLARHVEPYVELEERPEDNTIVGTDNANNETVTITFENQLPADWDCSCASPTVPCEHVAAVLRNAPEISLVYTDQP